MVLNIFIIFLLIYKDMIKLFEKYSNIQEVKDKVFVTAVETYDTSIIDFFLERGANLNAEGVLFQAAFDDKTFRYLLTKKIEVVDADYDFRKKMREDVEVQKALIDFGYEWFIKKTCGFHHKLSYDPDYKHVIQKYEDAEKYNL